MKNGRVVFFQPGQQRRLVMDIGHNAWIVHIYPGFDHGFHGTPETVFAGIRQNVSNHFITDHDGMTAPALIRRYHDGPLRRKEFQQRVGCKHRYIHSRQRHPITLTLKILKTDPESIHQFHLICLAVFQENHTVVGQFPLDLFIFVSSNHHDGKNAHLLVCNDDTANDGNGSHLQQRLSRIVIGHGNHAANSLELHTIPPTVILSIGTRSQ